MAGSLDLLAEEAATFSAASRSTATVRAYRSDWEHFTTWCSRHDQVPLPADPATVALYVTDLARTYKPSTISRRLASISVAHGRAGHASPTGDRRVQDITSGVRRQLGTAQKEAAPIAVGDLRVILALLPDSLAGRRDYALLLLGFAGALRRSELTAITLDDLTFRAEGILVRLRRSKTDAEGAGRDVAIPFGSDRHTCPVTALQTWLTAADITDGPILRSVDRHGTVGTKALSPQAVNLIVKRAAANAGMETSLLTAHSLRAGFATTAAMNGASERSIARQTGHRSMASVQRYVRAATVFSDNAVGVIGL